MTNHNAVAWDDAPDWAQYIAVDGDGKAYWYEFAPGQKTQGFFARTGRCVNVGRAFYTPGPMWQQRDSDTWVSRLGQAFAASVVFIPDEPMPSGEAHMYEIMRDPVNEIGMLRANLAARDRTIAKLQQKLTRVRLIAATLAKEMREDE